jgi:hypothetical protein
MAFSTISSPVIFGKEYNLLSFSICNYLHSLIASSVSGPNIILNILFSKTGQSMSFPSFTSTQKPSKITAGHILIIIHVLLDKRWNTKDSEQNGNKHSPSIRCS